MGQVHRQRTAKRVQSAIAAQAADLPPMPKRWQRHEVRLHLIAEAMEDNDAIRAEREVRALLAEIEQLVANDVRTARRREHSWAQLGDLLGVTGQTTNKQFKKQ